MNNDSNSTTAAFAKFVSNARYSDLPPEVVQQTKDYILDCIGCALGGWGVPDGKVVAGLSQELGTGDSTVLPTGQRLTPGGAALINAKLSHIIDHDETLFNYFHIGGVPVFAALACGEPLGANGVDLITATAVGYEFAFRFCHNYTLLSITPDGRTEAAPTAGYGFNTIAAAIASARIMGFDVDETRNAMGIAGYYVALPMCNKWIYSQPWGMQKYQDWGWFAHAGALAARFAALGYTGDRTVLDDFGQQSFWKAFGMSEFDFNGLTDALGQTWGIMNMGIKPFPCCRWYSTPIEVTLRIMRQHGIKPKDVLSIKLKLPPVVVSAYGDVSRWQEWPTKDGTHSQFSAGYNVACAITGIPAGFRWQLPHNLENPELAVLSSKVSVEPDGVCEAKMARYLQSGQPRGRLMTQVHYTVELQSTKGDYSESAEYVYGDSYDAEHAFTHEQIVSKFNENASAVLDPERAARVSDAVQTLDSCSDLRDFTRLFQ
jgi:2-methylcitrate dehydratase PrpD